MAENRLNEAGLTEARLTEVWTPVKLIQWTTNYFEKQGIPNPRLDAELLLAHALRLQRIDLYLRFDSRIGEKKLASFKELVQRRARREPLQYLTGETEFWGLKIKVTPDVLIPRPETELLVETALSEISRRQAAGGRGAQDPAALDIGTGSGCIAIALAKKIPNVQVVATDISKEALALAAENAALNGVAGQIQGTLADIAPWRAFAAAGKKFDLILSNPPYIRSADFPNLQPEVRDWEPRRALEGGEEGLDFYRRITEDAIRFLKPEGGLLFEIGEGQGEVVRSLLVEKGLKVTTSKDLQGVERIVMGRVEDG